MDGCATCASADCDNGAGSCAFCVVGVWICDQSALLCANGVLMPLITSTEANLRNSELGSSCTANAREESSLKRTRSIRSSPSFCAESASAPERL